MALHSQRWRKDDSNRGRNVFYETEISIRPKEAFKVQI